MSDSSIIASADYLISEYFLSDYTPNFNSNDVKPTVKHYHSHDLKLTNAIFDLYKQSHKLDMNNILRFIIMHVIDYPALLCVDIWLVYEYILIKRSFITRFIRNYKLSTYTRDLRCIRLKYRCYALRIKTINQR